MQFENNEYTRIDGFTLQNARGCTCGSGITCSNNAVIANNKITGNYEECASGGGITCSGNSLICNNTITGNTAYYQGGGIYCSGAAIIANNDITGNTVEEGSGGGITCDGNAQIICNQITGNTAYSVGGGISCSGANPTISRNTISGNIAGTGSGIYCGFGIHTVKMTSNVIIDNTTDGIYCDNRTADIINNTIAWNGTGSTGDGIRLTGTSAEYRVINNIVYDNCGVGIRGVSGINIELENNDVYDQSQNYINLGSVPASNISENPELDDQTHDISITSSSPCYNEGLNDVVNIGDQDIDGDARIMDNQVDIGADEVNGCIGKVLTLSPENPRTVIGASAHVQATVIDFMTGEPVSGVQVDIDVDTGEIEKVTRNGVEVAVGAQSTYGITDSNGIVDIYVRRSTTGDVVVTASITQCNGVAEDYATATFDSCENYTISVSPKHPRAATGTNARIYATIKHAVTGEPLVGVKVNFSITDGDGNIVYIHPEGYIDAGGQTGYGITGLDGKAYADVASSTEGYVDITATIDTCGGTIGDSSEIEFVDAANDDWPMFQHDVAHTGCTLTPLGTDLEYKWHKVLSGNTDGTLWSSPVVANGIVYVGTNSAAGDLYAFDAVSGDQIAHVTLGSSNSQIYGTPCVYDGIVYVGTFDGRLHARNASNLSVDWTKTFTGESVTGGLTIYDGAVYVGSYVGSPGGVNSGRLHTIDLTSHNDKANSPATIHYGVDYTTPAINTEFSSGARVYVSDYSCYVTAAQCSDGLKKWEWARDGSSIFSSPTVSGGYVFVGSHVNGMYRIIDAGTNYQEPNPYMYIEAGSFINSTAAAWQDKLYFGTNTGHLCSIDTESFTTAEWTTNLGVVPITSSPLISTSTGLLFAASENGAIFVFDTTDGSYDLLYDTRQDIESLSIKSSFAAADGRLYIVAGNSAGRYLYCFGP